MIFSNFCRNYFDDHVDYPRVDGEILPLGTAWAYVASTFLDGFINYQKIQRAYLLHRYIKQPEENERAAKAFNEGCHTKIWELLQDDVLLLSKNETNEWWFYWFDRDVSDCCIGRFITDDSDGAVLQLFEEFVYETQRKFCLGYVSHNQPPILLDHKKFKGWISSS